MFHKVRVLESALKHGYSKNEIAYAWCNYEYDSKDYERADPRSVHARYGISQTKKKLELIGAWDERAREWQVFHAMKARRSFLKAIGMEV